MSQVEHDDGAKCVFDGCNARTALIERKSQQRIAELESQLAALKNKLWWALLHLQSAEDGLVANRETLQGFAEIRALRG